MTPDFAERIDPIFLYVLRALHRLDDQPAAYAEYARDELHEMLEKIRIESGAVDYRNRDWPNAVYAITCWIDEMFSVEHYWKGSEWWRDNPLEDSRQANSRFYEDAKKANREDSIETFYLCAMLGFKGLYSNLEDPANAEQRDNLGLPESHADWVEDLQEKLVTVKQQPQGQPKTEPRKEISVATPLWRWKTALSPWIFSGLLGIVLYVITRLGM